MEKSEKKKGPMLHLLREMCQEESLDYVLQGLRRDLGGAAPDDDAVRAYLLDEDASGLDALQMALVIDKVLECAEINFRTMCDLLRYQQLKAAGVVNSVEEFMAIMHSNVDDEEGGGNDEEI